MAEFDSLSEKAQIYDLLTASVPPEREIKKEEVMKRAIEFSLEELKEVNEEFDKFTERISHLSIYNHLYKDVILPYFSKLNTDANHLIQKNYTTEELEIMPRDTYNMILKQQKVRLDLIRAITSNYKLAE